MLSPLTHLWPLLLQNAHHTHGSHDSHPVSNSSASISEGFNTSSDDDGVALSVPRPAAAPLLGPPAPLLSPLLHVNASPLTIPAVPPRLEAAAFVAAMGQHSTQLRSALVILGYQDLWPSEHVAHRSFNGTLAGTFHF